MSCSLIGLIICISLSALVQADEPAPFVAGFERFARHGDIELSSAGSLLLTELNCSACHAATSEVLKPKGGPSFAGAGVRLQASWIRNFLESPSLIHSTSTMPDMLASFPEAQRKSAAEALTAYLMTLVEPSPEPKASGASPIPLEFHDRGDESQGKRLFHTVGCIACHEPATDYDIAQVQSSDLDKLLDTLDPEELKELGLSSSARKVDSIPLPQLAEKYSRKSLTYFLLYPEHVRPATRMPSFDLKPVEAADIAGYLIPATENRSLSKLKGSSPQLIAQGKALFAEFRCANCHQVSSQPTSKPPLANSKPLARLKLDGPNSCVANAGAVRVITKRGQPSYRLDDAQLAALEAALGRRTRSTAKQDLQLHLLQFNCYACHQRDELGGVDRYRKPYFETVNNVDIGDEGRLPPMLTGVGNRLNADWMEKVLRGQGNIRPHMTTRMPIFSKSLVKALPAMFINVDRTSQSQSIEAAGNVDEKKLAAAGRQLMDSGCVQCHSFRGHALPGVIGVDLSDVTTRLQTKWLHDFLLDPGTFKPRTRMPTFFPEGMSQQPEVLNGNVPLQVAAMVAYLADLKNQPLPQRIEEARAQSFELSPTSRPILLRTFMPVGGLQSIAVGFPQKRHFAFDAERCSIAEAWSGKFLDAESTWFDRFAKPIQPLGSNTVIFPEGTSIGILANKQSTWPANSQATKIRFGGYDLDSAGIPTFHYQIAGFQISDRIEPKIVEGDVAGLQRILTAQAMSSNTNESQLWFRALVDKKPQPINNRPVNSQAGLLASNGLAVILISNIPTGEVRNMAGQTEWIIPLEIQANQPTTLELLYQWK